MDPQMNDDAAQSPAADPAKKKLVTRVHATQVLPSERFPFEAHLAVLTNAVVRSKFGQEAVDTEQMEDGYKIQSAMLNVNFLVDVGFLAKDKRKYLPTPECVKFVKMLKLDEPRAKAALRDIIRTKWFTEAALNYLSLHVTAGEDVIVKELALASEVSDPELKARSLRILVDYLAWSGVIVRDNGQVSVSPDLGATPDSRMLEAPVSASMTSGSPLTARTAPPAATPPATPPAPTTNDPTWLNREWPSHFRLSVKPELKSIRILEATVKELKAAIEIASESESAT